MSARKFNFSHLTDADLDAIEKMYPNAVETVTIPATIKRRANYKILSMLATAGAAMPEGVKMQAEEETAKPAYIKNVK